MKAFKPDKTREANESKLPCGPTQTPCAYCGKPVKVDEDTLYIHMVNGGSALATVEEGPQHDGEPGEMGLYPVGQTCAKKAGKHYVRTLNTESS